MLLMIAIYVIVVVPDGWYIAGFGLLIAPAVPVPC